MNIRFLYVSNVVLAIAVVALFWLHFAGDKQASAPKTASVDSNEEVLLDAEGADDMASVDTLASFPVNASLRIVYVNADSIIANYAYYKKLRSTMESKAKRSETELETEGRKLEQEYADAQRKAVSMSQEQLAMIEQSLMRKQQNLMMLRESLSQELAEEEEKLDKILREKIQKYFKQLSKQEGYDYVLSYHGGSNVIFGNPGLDITKRVISDLNADYQRSLK